MFYLGIYWILVVSAADFNVAINGSILWFIFFLLGVKSSKICPLVTRRANLVLTVKLKWCPETIKWNGGNLYFSQKCFVWIHQDMINSQHLLWRIAQNWQWRGKKTNNLLMKGYHLSKIILILYIQLSVIYNLAFWKGCFTKNKHNQLYVKQHAYSCQGHQMYSDCWCVNLCIRFIVQSLVISVKV